MIPKKVNISNNLNIRYKRPKNIIIAGMGGSAIGGDLLKDWLRNELQVPIEVCRNYHLPAYAGKETLVLAVSYSGNTEETLSAYLEAVHKQCMTVAFTSGGLLQKFSQELGVPFLRLPSGYPPRGAIAYLLFPLMASLKRFKLIHTDEEEIKEAVAVVTDVSGEVKPSTPTALNPSKRLAIGLKGSIPFVCGFDFYESVATRMKTQFNENSKVPAKTEHFSELNHNETVGWTGSTDLPRNFSIVLIRDEQEPIEIRTRVDFTRSLVLDRSAERVLEVRARGKGRLARMLSVMYVGDFASIYLAILYGVDPTPVLIVDELKRKLEEKTNKTMELMERFKRLKTY
jgi:glucose/mannose-6-phosphate isomerase